MHVAKKSAIALLVAAALYGCATQNHAALCDEHLEKALVLARSNGYEASKVEFDLAGKEALSVDSFFSYPRVLREQAKTAFASKNLDETLQLCNQLYSIYDKLLADARLVDQHRTLTEDKAAVSLILGKALTDKHDFVAAKKILTAANVDLRKANGDLNLGFALTDELIACSHAEGSRESGSNSQLDLEDLMHSIEYLKMGRVNMGRLSYKDALSLFEKGREIAKSAGAKANVLVATEHIGVCKYALNRTAEAKKEFVEALDLATKETGTEPTNKAGALVLAAIFLDDQAQFESLLMQANDFDDGRTREMVREACLAIHFRWFNLTHKDWSQFRRGCDPVVTRVLEAQTILKIPLK